MAILIIVHACLLLCGWFSPKYVNRHPTCHTWGYFSTFAIATPYKTLYYNCLCSNMLALGRYSCNFQFLIPIRDWYVEYFLWNCIHRNATCHDWWLVNISSGNGIVPSSNKPLLEPMWTRTSGTLWHHYASMLRRSDCIYILMGLSDLHQIYIK